MSKYLHKKFKYEDEKREKKMLTVNISCQHIKEEKIKRRDQLTFRGIENRWKYKSMFVFKFSAGILIFRGVILLPAAKRKKKQFNFNAASH